MADFPTLSYILQLVKSLPLPRFTSHCYVQFALSLRKESPYIFAKSNPLNTDTFYGALKQAAVIYRQVTRSANGFAIIKKQDLSSFVAGQGTFVPCVFRQTFKQALVAFLFVVVFFLSMKLHF